MTMVGPSDRCSERFSNAVPKLTEQIVAAADGDGTWEEVDFFD
jgi:hypothetical protein